MNESKNSPFHEHFEKIGSGKLAGTLAVKINRSAKHFSVMFQNPSIFKSVKSIRKIEDKLDLLLELARKEIAREPQLPISKNDRVRAENNEYYSRYKTYISLMDGNPAVTMDAATDYLKCSPGFIKALVKQGALREIHIRSRVYFSKEDLLKLYAKFYDK